MIIGREREKQLLNRAYLSKESEFIAAYGRRRVGKTYLIREFFVRKKCLFVHATGAYRASLRVQLERFSESLSKTFFDGVPLKLDSWALAFKVLQEQVQKHSDRKIVIFFDELPWMATKRSGLLQLIDYYWNHYWSGANNVILVVCGSSAAWLIKKIIYNKGGLHNRVTCELHLLPFNLYETKLYLKYRKIKLTHRHILLLYMALGGIPYYLNYIEHGLTADQNIQNIFFNKNSPLRDEFKKLFDSLFEYSEAYIEIIRLVAKDRAGVPRAKIELSAKLSTNGGRLSERLSDLCYAGFLEEKLPWHKNQGVYYKLIDEFSLFQLAWVIPRKSNYDKDYWISTSKSQSYKIWVGYAFETVCMKHIDQIIAATNIKSINTIDSWRFVPTKAHEDGAQIDLLIDRNDDAITLCEIKFTSEPFVIDKQYAKSLQNKVETFKAETKTRKQIFFVIISASGLKPSMYSEELISSIVTLADLFNRTE